MRVVLTIGNIIVLSMLAATLPCVPVAAAGEQPMDIMGTQGSLQTDTQPMNLETQAAPSRDVRAGGELGKGQEIPMRAPEGEGAHLLAPESKHFLFMGDASVNAELLEQFRIQDEISSYAF